jgi:hypothetical protein
MVQLNAAAPGSVPLTFLQRARLIIDCLPALFFVLVLVFTLIFFDDIYGAPPPVALLLFLGFVILWMGYQALKRLRDLMLGVALVCEDVLKSSGSSRQSWHKFGRFAQMGTLVMIPKAYHSGRHGWRHRITYSPASKLVWVLEPLDQPR